MTNFVTKFLISASLCLTAFAPAQAAPVMPQKPVLQISETAPVVDIHYKRRGFHRHNRHFYFNGHRGYRHHRHGYRHYNGYWFPPAAFALGVIIGSHSHGGGYGIIRPGYTHPQHVRYCYNRYRSYRKYDNTFQPYHGPRRAMPLALLLRRSGHRPA
jgi:hypothetical protein